VRRVQDRTVAGGPIGLQPLPRIQRDPPLGGRSRDSDLELGFSARLARLPARRLGSFGAHHLDEEPGSRRPQARIELASGMARTTLAAPTSPILVVMGISGSGKTTTGLALAERLDLPYSDGDAFHTPANIDKMARGVPLSDADRLPWLETIGAWLRAQQALRGGVVSCSALRRAYRDVLTRSAPRALFLHLTGSPALIAERARGRSQHFMPVSLQASQIATLEPLGPDERGLVVDVSLPVPAIVDVCIAHLRALG
jgi:gluconokinase